MCRDRRQWGDEARADCRLAVGRADVVVRFQAGTTPATRSSSAMSVQAQPYAAGIVRLGKLSIIGTASSSTLGAPRRDRDNRRGKGLEFAEQPEACDNAALILPVAWSARPRGARNGVAMKKIGTTGEASARL